MFECQSKMIYKQTDSSTAEKKIKMKKHGMLEQYNTFNLNSSTCQNSDQIKTNGNENEKQIIIEDKLSNQTNNEIIPSKYFTSNSFSQQNTPYESIQDKNQLKLEYDETQILQSIERNISNSSTNTERLPSFQNESSPNQNKQIKVGRPLKKSLESAKQQKFMKEFDIENKYGSQYSSENYQLLITTIIIFGSDNKNKNKYVTKKYYLGEKDLNFNTKIQNHSTQEQKRMWLPFYKIKRILNTQSKEILETLWKEFEVFAETTKVLYNKEVLHKKSEEKLSKIQNTLDCSQTPSITTHLKDIECLRKLFNSSNILNSILSDPKYIFFTEQCFDPHFNQEQVNLNKKEIHKLKYSEIQKILLSSHNLKKSDFIFILFSCAICDYFNILSPYYDIICNLL